MFLFLYILIVYCICCIIFIMDILKHSTKVLQYLIIFSNILWGKFTNRLEVFKFT